MRVALVYRNFNMRGSLERDVVLLARELSRQGVDVHVYSNPATRGVVIPGVTHHDVVPATVSRSRFGYPLECGSFAVAATRAIRRDRSLYDIVHVGSIAAWEHDVVTVHGVTRAEQELWLEHAGRGYRFGRARAAVAPLVGPQLMLARTIQRLQFRPGRYRRVIAVTNEVRDDLVSVHNVPLECIDVVPYAPDLSLFTSGNGYRAEIRSSLGLDERQPLLLFVGHDFERKGLGDAIASLEGLDPLAHLLVVGGGDRGRFEDAARVCGVLERVHFIGATETPQRYFSAADVFVLPTRHEPWGLTLIEAMAAGVPVVTTAVAGAAREVARAGAGIVLDDGSPGPLRDAIAGLLTDPERRRELGEHGRKMAGEHSPEGQAKAVFEVYERILDERRERRLGRAPTWIAAFPDVRSGNAYQRLLYEHLKQRGVELAPGARFELRWLLPARRRVGVLHFHWPEARYTFGRGPEMLRPALSWVKLGLFALRLWVARALGYRLVWTVHQLSPHDRLPSALDRVAAHVLGRACHILLAHDSETATAARRVLDRRVEIVPHGNYIDAYPAGRSRAVVRAELGIPEEAFVFLVFGELRRYKNLDLVLDAFVGARLPEARVVVAGYPKDHSVEAELLRRAQADPRIVPRTGFVPDERVSELFAATDAVVQSRGDGGTSGSLILALSLGAPVVVADRPAYTALTGGEEAGWLFEPDDEPSLRFALERAVADRAAAQEKGAAARALASRLDWGPIAERTAALLCGDLGEEVA